MVEPRKPARKGPRRGIAELLYRLRTEATQPRAQAMSVGLGAFIAAFPVYGLHLPLSIVLSRFLRLNLITTFLPTNLNNPFSAPFLLYAEIQIGGLVRNGEFYAHTFETLRNVRIFDFAMDIFLGSMIVGIISGTVLGVGAYFLALHTSRDRLNNLLIEKTALRYLDAGYLQWEITRAALRLNQDYVGLVRSGLFPREGAVTHLRCGRGILLVLLDEYTRMQNDASQEFDPVSQSNGMVLCGVDDRKKFVTVARTALGDESAVVEIDPSDFVFSKPCSVVLFDAIRHLGGHWLSVVERAIEALGPLDVLVVYERGGSVWNAWRSPRVTEEQITELTRAAGLEIIEWDSIHKCAGRGFLTVARRDCTLESS